MDQRLVAGVAALAAGLVLAVGCGKSAGSRSTVPTSEVSGKVTLNGSPLEGAEVNFLGEKFAGTSHTVADGTYKLQAQPGANKVYIRRLEGWTPKTDPTALDGLKQILPPKYSSPEKSELKFTVPQGGANGADFQLIGK